MTERTHPHTLTDLRFPTGLSILGIFWVLLLDRYTGGADSDTLWHLLAGNYMLSNQVILKTDIFSWTMIGKPWFPAEWLYEVVIAFLNLHFGAKGLVVLHAIATALQMGILYQLARRIGASSWWSGFVAGGLTYCMYPYITLRPQVFSYLLFTWMLSILLLRFNRPRIVYWLPLLSLVWVNFHLSYILLILWVGFEWLIGFFRLRIGRLHQHAYRSQLHLFAAWLLCMAATLLNPETYHVYPYVWSISNNEDLKNNIVEYLSPNFHNDSIFQGFLLPSAAIWLILIATRRAIPLRYALYVVGTFTLSLISVRYYPYFFICSCILVAAAGPELARSIHRLAQKWPAQFWQSIDRLPDRARSIVRNFGSAIRLRITRELIGFVCLLLVFVTNVPSYWQRATWSEMESGYPRGAVQYLLDHKITDRVLNAYQWGGYFEQSGIKGFVDGRTDLFLTSSVFMDYIRITSINPDIDTILSNYNPSAIVMPTGSNVTTYLAHAPGYKQVYSDGTATIYERTKEKPKY